MIKNALNNDINIILLLNNMALYSINYTVNIERRRRYGYK